MGDATTHSIVDAFNAGFRNAEKEGVLLVERTMMKVDDFKMLYLENYNLCLLFHIQIERVF